MSFNRRRVRYGVFRPCGWRVAESLKRRGCRRASSLSRSSSTRLLRMGESGPPCGVPSSTGRTKPSSITPALRNARMSLSTRLSDTDRVLTLTRLAAARRPQNDVAITFASARSRSSPDELANERRNDHEGHERCRCQEGDQSSGLFARESASIDMCGAASRRSGFPVLPEIAVARECNHFSIAKPSNGFLTVPKPILMDG